MIPRPQLLSVALLAGVCSAGAKDVTGYLAMIGPAPLRFARRVEAVPPEPLPPAEKPVEPKEPATKADPAVPSRPDISASAPKSEEPPQAPQPAAFPVPMAEPPAVSPYALLQYLLKPGSTNAVQPGVVLPQINFAPPVQASPPPSSSATYQKGP